MIRNVAFTLVFMVCLCNTGILAADLSQLTILGPNYPRVFYFRASESACSEKSYPTYESWENNFDGLMGIMGKCLMEECLHREPRNPEFFNRYKQVNPERVVLLHFNGNSRDPLYHRENYFPGHWIYRKAVMVTQDVPAERGESTISVSDTRKFRVDSGRYRSSNDDIALFGIRDGKHDWYACEEVQLLSIDHDAGTITVKRGCYGTEPHAFTAGQARAAAHQVEGPWGPHNHLLWYYNYSSHCPKDRDGKVCSDILVDDLARWFGKGGTLEHFDGLEFDVLFNATRGDTDGDGESDNGIIDGINNYGIGVVEFGRKLRARMGRDFIIQADGALGRGGNRSQRNWGNFNGIESEGWPNLNDWEIDDWSGGLNRHFFWQQNAYQPAFNYINHKWVQGIPDRPGHHKQVDVPFSRHRLVFAAAQFFDAMICYSSTPKPPAHTGYTFWSKDVSVPVEASLEFSIGMGPLSPERSDGVWFKVYAAPLEGGKPGTFEQVFEADSKEHKWLPQSIGLGKFAGRSVRFKFVADCGPEENATTDHAYWGAARVVSPAGTQALVTSDEPVKGFCVRNRGEKPLDASTGARVNFKDAIEIGGVALPAYDVHPPYRRVAGSGKYPIWDEFVQGADNVLGWLGKPEAPAVHVPMLKADLLGGHGSGQSLAARITGDVTVAVSPAGVQITPNDPTTKEVTFTVNQIPADGQDLYVSVKMEGDSMAGYPREMARFATVAASGGINDLMAGKLAEQGMCLRGKEEEPIDRATGAQVVRGRRTINGVSQQTVFAHPPWKEGTGYTFWSKDVHIPVDSELRFYIGMGAKSPERSDGVWFKVYATVLSDAGVGVPKKIFEVSSKAHEWLPQVVSLSDYAGKRVRLKFVSDAGPHDDSTTDHSHWGDVKIVKRGIDESDLTEAVEFMTWVNDTSFTSSFYFSHIRTDRVDLSFTVESGEPVTLESITVHAHPDAMFRVFEKGLVLANPARRPYTFDLSTMTPGHQYRRIKATRFQDDTTNNGQPVGTHITLGERDALFLLRTE